MEESAKKDRDSDHGQGQQSSISKQILEKRRQF